jgi:hypothetical protein
MIQLESEGDFKRIPNLRLRQDSDLTLIAKTIYRIFKKDHLYFHGKGVLGIYYERPTTKAAIYARKWWIDQCGGELLDSSQIGDFDGIILFRPKEISDIPTAFFKSTLLGRSGFKSSPLAKPDTARIQEI